MSHDEGLSGVATWVDDARRTASKAGSLDFEPRPGTSLGRYRVKGIVGRGAMGVVVSAHDPELDRTVAIKILHRSGARSRDRIRTEAQALARLNHPNVIAVYDVGEVGDHTFVAMDFVEGVTLRRWLEEAPRSPAEILEVFVAAGRGLAAAHDAGLVHRDFKPDNVIIGRSGEGSDAVVDRVRVLDFGLAMESDSSTDSSSRRGPADSGLAGTPRYMAPEQFRREEVGPAADQFAFCVALHEALWGEPPFPGMTAPERAAALENGERRPAPASKNVSRRVVRAVEKGLELDAGHRWPSMHALLDRLRPSRPWGWFGVLVMAAVVCVGVVASRSDDEDPCRKSPDRLAGIWDDAQRVSIRRAFTSSGVRYAGDAWSRVDERIEDWAQAWFDASRRNCLATRREGTQSERQMDARALCLQRQVGRAAAVTELLSNADADTIVHAAELAASLPDPSACDEVSRSPNKVLVADPTQVVVIETAYEELDRCKALETARKLQKFHACARKLAEYATSVGFDPLTIEANMALGRSLARMGRHEKATKLLEAQYFAAVRLPDDELARDAAQYLVQVYALELRRLDDARTWLGYAKRGARSDLVRAKQARLEALVLRASEDVEGAMEKARECVRYARAAGDESIEAFGQETLGSLLFEARSFGEAEVSLREALKLRVRLAGPMHPSVALARNNIAVLTLSRGKLREALELFADVLEHRTTSLPHPSQEVASTARNVSVTLSRLGRDEEALAYARLSALEYALSSDTQSADYTAALTRVADVMLTLGRTDEAWTALQAAREIQAARTWDDVRTTAATDRITATYYDAIGQPERAIGLMEQVLRDLSRARVPQTAFSWEVTRVRFAGMLANQGRCVRLKSLMDDIDMSRVRAWDPRYWIDIEAALGRCALTIPDEAAARHTVAALAEAEPGLPEALRPRARQAREELQRRLQ